MFTNPRTLGSLTILALGWVLTGGGACKGASDSKNPEKAASRDEAPRPMRAGPPDGGTTATPRPGPRRVRSKEPVARLTAGALLAELKANKKAYDQKYDGNLVEVTGFVSDFGVSTAGPYLSVVNTATPKPTDTDFVQCITRDSEPWATANQGRPVRVVGRVTSWDHPLLHQCRFVVTGGKRPPVLTVKDLLTRQRRATSRDALARHDTHYIVEGTIAAVELKQFRVLLKKTGASKVTVFVHFASLNRQHRSLKVGQPIRAIGRYRVGNDRVGIAVSQVITKPAPK